GMRILLKGGGTLEVIRKSLQDRLIVRVESVCELLVGGAVPRLHQLHDSDSRYRRCGDELDHHFWVADVRCLDIEPCRFEGAKELLRSPSAFDRGLRFCELRSGSRPNTLSKAANEWGQHL